MVSTRARISCVWLVSAGVADAEGGEAEPGGSDAGHGRSRSPPCLGAIFYEASFRIRLLPEELEGRALNFVEQLARRCLNSAAGGNGFAGLLAQASERNLASATARRRRANLRPSCRNLPAS